MVTARMSELQVDLWPESWLKPDAPTNPHATVRTFGQPESSIRIKLYRDHAAWCPYCHKVWLQLEEKRIPYTVEKINMRAYGDKPAAFMAKVPGGLLPVIEFDGRVVTESAVIMQLIEDEFPNHQPLLPRAGTADRARADGLMRLERLLFSDWLGWLCNDWDPEGKRARFEKTMDIVAKELEASGGPFFMGSQLTLVDITFTSMMERVAASIAYYKGSYIRGQGRWPAVERWFDALEKRETYLGTKSDYYTHCHDLPPQLGGCAMAPEGTLVAASLDGQARIGGGWRLPLAPLTSYSMPEPYSPGDNPEEDRLEAAAKVIRNRAALTRFALRGPGRPGPKPVSAPLADPTAVPALEHTDAMDAGLRSVAYALVKGSGGGAPAEVTVSPSPSSVPSPSFSSKGPAKWYPVAPVIQGAEYVRDRVGVPRDLRLPAARQLRAYLNRLIDQLAGV